MKKVLMIAHAFPPFRSVGHSIRVVKFIKYLPAFGWLPVVLTIDDRMEYQDYLKLGSESLLSDIPKEVSINRTNAGEPSLEYLEKEMKFGQRNWLAKGIVKVFGGIRRWTYRNLALPDPRIVWLPFALWRGLRIVKSKGIDVIFTTCPPHSAVLVGACLKKLTGKPLVLDFRDDWIDTPWYQSKPKIIQDIERIMEYWAVKTANKVILVTEWSQKAFQDRYPTQQRDKFIFISNGCDLNDFTSLKSITVKPSNANFSILHAGSLSVTKSSTWNRSPDTIFQAVRNILQDNPQFGGKICLAFTGSLPETQRQFIKEMGLSSAVKELGFLSYDDLIHLMKASAMLLTINYDGFITLIPGKIYEYWAVGGPPILLLSHPGAATSLVDKYSLGFSVDPTDIAGIEQAILTAFLQYQTGEPMRLSTTGIESFDRQALTCKLAQVLIMVR